MGLRLSPSSIRHILTKVDSSRHDEAIDPGRFTLREAIAHLADWEPILRDRIVTAVNSPETVIHGQDEEQMAIDHHYATWPVEESLRKLEEERARTVAFCETVTEEQWAQVATHNERGPMTALSYAWTIVGHDQYHVEQFARYL